MLRWRLLRPVSASDGAARLSRERYELLMSTHWMRVGIVSAFGILVVWMLAQSAGPHFTQMGTLAGCVR
jgi:hypothetical protein